MSFGYDNDDGDDDDDDDEDNVYGRGRVSLLMTAIRRPQERRHAACVCHIKLVTALREISVICISRFQMLL